MPKAVLAHEFVTNQKCTVVTAAAFKADHKYVNYSIFAINSSVDFGFNKFDGNCYKKGQTGAVHFILLLTVICSNPKP